MSRTVRSSKSGSQDFLPRGDAGPASRRQCRGSPHLSTDLCGRSKIAPAWINCGVALRELGRFEAGVACLQRGVALKPEDAGAHSNLGNALRAAGRLDEARNSRLAAIDRDPTIGSFVYNLELVLRDLGNLDGAIKRFDAAEAMGCETAELKWDRALSLLLHGDWALGFEEYRWRWDIPDAELRKLEALVWTGEDIACICRAEVRRHHSVRALFASAGWTRREDRF